ncbi:MAG TPA: MOSC N-terminal beta barrel domain-containing protein [Jatrophihabitantaceae bacterium]|nr:MOSC N-terminal beta barrel domain-containing protein [Jatrophihabitantaceae bacterium]
MASTVTQLFRYPVKSCRGESLRDAVVERWGFAGDRRWMLVDASGECVTAREYPRLVLVVPQLVEGGVRFSGPHADDLAVATPTGTPLDVTVHGRGPYPALLADERASAWFAALIGEPVRLVHQADPSARVPSQTFAGPDDRVSLADAYPFLVAAEESLAALNAWIAAGPMADQGPLPVRRFRPNIVVSGAPAWSEDGWRRVRIGEVTFRAVKGCDRCVLTTVDPDTAAKGKEPIATLARHRKWDGAAWFGMQFVPDEPFGTVHVGDEVEVLDAVHAPDGPPR